jgi:hypothetical protein
LRPPSALKQEKNDDTSKQRAVINFSKRLIIN